jgi:hypothetical protein
MLLGKIAPFDEEFPYLAPDGKTFYSLEFPQEGD